MMQGLGVRRALAVALVVVGCAAPRVEADPRPDSLPVRLDGSLAVPALRGAQVSALVLDRETGGELFARNPDLALAPASNLKVLTGVAALAAFGPAHRFATEVLASGEVNGEGAVEALFVRGGGDPALTSEQWWRLAADLRIRGLRRVRGDLVMDDTLFDGERWHPSWGEITSRAYHAPVGALSANYGAFFVAVEAASRPGGPVRIIVDPPVSYLRVVNQARTGVAGSPESIAVKRRSAGDFEKVVVTGSIPAGSEPLEFWRSVASPARYAGAVLRMQLEANEIAVDGGVRLARVPDGAAPLYRFDGKPLGEVTRLFLKNSNNFIAEVLVKSMGIRDSRDGIRGSWKRGIPEQVRQLQSLGLDTAGLQLVDGSGLSRENRVPARLMVSALRLADASFAIGPEFSAALPIAAADGTLERRADAAVGRVRAKTGLLTGVSGLSGYAKTVEGRELVFSVLVNGYRGSDTEAMRALDRFLEELVGTSPGGYPAPSGDRPNR
jgi:D-alanyl-D-alanine carboxypeptidase/D-alanyl-D-alanine-endopeptidase (penicillin-binding protein 4)